MKKIVLAALFASSLLSGAVFAGCGEDAQKLLAASNGFLAFHLESDAKNFLNSCHLDTKLYKIVKIDKGPDDKPLYVFAVIKSSKGPGQ